MVSTLPLHPIHLNASIFLLSPLPTILVPVENSAGIICKRDILVEFSESNILLQTNDGASQRVVSSLTAVRALEDSAFFQSDITKAINNIATNPNDDPYIKRRKQLVSSNSNNSNDAYETARDEDANDNDNENDDSSFATGIENPNRCKYIHINIDIQREQQGNFSLKLDNIVFES